MLRVYYMLLVSNDILLLFSNIIYRHSYVRLTGEICMLKNIHLIYIRSHFIAYILFS